MKADKIKLALEKLKEAKVKKVRQTEYTPSVAATETHTLRSVCIA